MDAKLWEPGQVFGELHPEWVRQLKLPLSPVLAEINIEVLSRFSQDLPQYQAVSPYPGTSRDLSLVVDEPLSYADLVSTIQKHVEDKSQLGAIHFVGLYRGDPLPSGKKCISFRLDYSAMERTLTDDEVNASYFRLIESITAAPGIAIR